MIFLVGAPVLQGRIVLLVGFRFKKEVLILRVRLFRTETLLAETVKVTVLDSRAFGGRCILI